MMIGISDCTLREGEQQPGIVLDIGAKLRIAEHLAAIGIKRAEVGTPAVSEEERASIKAICKGGLISEPIAVCRSKKEDVDAAAECGVWGVVVSSPVSPWQLDHKLRWSVDQMIDTAGEVHSYARTLGLRTFASAYDTFRTPRASLLAIYSALQKDGLVEGIRLVDTVGIGTPAKTTALVGLLKSSFDVPLEVHFHDDLGLAMANAMAAVEAGAEGVSCSIAGVGERAGNVATEEIIVALEIGLGVSTGVALERLGPAAIEIVAELGIPLAPNKAVCGENSFRHVAGLSTAGYLRDPLVAQPFLASEVGRKSEIALGKVSGKDALLYALDDLGIDPNGLDTSALLTSVKETSERTRRLVSPAELLRLVDRMQTNGGGADG